MDTYSHYRCYEFDARTLPRRRFPWRLILLLAVAPFFLAVPLVAFALLAPREISARHVDGLNAAALPSPRPAPHLSQRD